MAAWCAGVVLAAGLALAHAGVAHAQQNVVLVFDASGSMAARIDGRRKIDIARDVVRRLLPSLRQDTRLGLVAYGHRRKGDCGDIEVISPPVENAARALGMAMQSLRPLGKTPLGAAVEQAARLLRHTEEAARVIVISDGLENCGADVCALASRLKRDGVDFVVHVVGFDISRREEAGLACLARNTGGMYVAARDADSLAEALNRTIEAVQAPPPQPQPQPVAQPPLKVRVLVKDGGPEWEDTIHFYLLSPNRDAAGRRAVVARALFKRSGHAFDRIAPGDYVLRVEPSGRKLLAREVPVRIGETPLEETIVLNVGAVRPVVRPTPSARPHKAPVEWQVLYPEQNPATGKRRVLHTFHLVKPGQILWLPAGKWVMRAEVNNVKYLTGEGSIEVRPGAMQDFSLVIPAGWRRFEVMLSENPDRPWTGGVSLEVLGPQADLRGRRRMVLGLTVNESSAVALVPAGRWLLRTTLVGASHIKTTRPIEVGAGDEGVIRVNMNAATVRFDLMADGRPYGGLATLEVLAGKPDLRGRRKRVLQLYKAKSGRIAVLPAGRHLLRVKTHDGSNLAAEMPIDIVAGEEQAIRVELTRE